MDNWRPSWLVCAVCKQPHTPERPVLRYEIEQHRRAWVAVHEECLPAAQADLKDGFNLVRSEAHPA